MSIWWRDNALYIKLDSFTKHFSICTKITRSHATINMHRHSANIVTGKEGNIITFSESKSWFILCYRRPRMKTPVTSLWDGENPHHCEWKWVDCVVDESLWPYSRFLLSSRHCQCVQYTWPEAETASLFLNAKRSRNYWWNADCCMSSETSHKNVNSGTVITATNTFIHFNGSRRFCLSRIQYIRQHPSVYIKCRRRLVAELWSETVQFM